jgi:DNA mismatch endonuclease (patch repair protein)
MGWHSITIWECELKPSKKEETLKSLVYTLNKIWLEDHQAVVKSYPKLEEEGGMLKAAEDKM